MSPSNKTLYDYFCEFAELRGDDTFLFDESRTYTVIQAFGTAKHLARQLCERGIRRGDSVAVKADRTVETVLAFFALQFIGGVAVMRDPRDEITENRIIADGSLTVDGQTRALGFTENASDIEPSNDGGAATIVIFTSGSTGARKAVKLSQYNFINNSLDTRDIGGYKSDDVNMLIVPVHHVFGLALVITAAVLNHGIFIPRFVKSEYLLDCIEKYGVTRLNGVPSMYLALAERAGERKLRLRCGLIGGGPCSREQFVKIESALGLRLVPVYGMSECIGISCGSCDDGLEARAGSVGRVYSMNTVKIADDGEVLVDGPAVACGYLDGDVRNIDGFVHTGDLGYVDADGFMHITGRKKDIIIRNGNNLSAVDIERKILSLDGVEDACVVGVPDEKCGEVPCALIVGENVESRLDTVLTKIEMPARVIFTDSMPRTSSGKHDKQYVRSLF